MSQRRQKKELSIMDNVSSLTDHELRAAFKKYDISPGPITDSTRNIYRNKLASLMEEEETGSPNFNESRTNFSRVPPSAATIEEEDEDSSDEDFEVQGEELDEEDEEIDEEFEDEEEDLLSELQDEEATLSRINNSGYGDTTAVNFEASNSILSRGPVILTISLVVVTLGIYTVGRNNQQLLESLKPILRWLVLFVVLAPFIYVAYRTYRFYSNRRHEESQRVCSLVSEALELLQSPETPKGLMPILHIRDTLLTPAERKTKQMNVLWQKAVKFIEEHESRVKVELVNIDGEDFRAWKWIGSRKL